MSKAIVVENLSKVYQLGDIGTGTISRDLERYWARLRGKEDPYLKIAEVNDRTKAAASDMVWSLNNLSFGIEQGDAVGIIGRNGAGKSTLLKILSRVTSPTHGSVKIKGRIASLLEVGTGFHGDLTGKENIFLNGAILGMRKSEIKRKFDEIVDFSGVERYIDTPVKRYSSGMYVRLAFAVAAYLESEILIVDEVLAVGDAEFQKKCLGKMGDISKGEGRTVLFVSHNMGSIMQLCQKGILLQDGQLHGFSDVKSIIGEYLTFGFRQDSFHSEDPFSFFRKIWLCDFSGTEKASYLFSETIVVRFKLNIVRYVPGLTLSIIIKDRYENPVTSSHYLVDGQAGEPATIKALIPGNFLLPGDYKIEPVLHIPNVEFVQQISSFISLYIEDSGNEHTPYRNGNLGAISLPVAWQKD